MSLIKSGCKYAWPLLGLLFLTIPFYRILFYSDRALFYRDLVRDILVQKSIWAESMLAGNGIPLWNHFSLGGAPFYSMIVGSPLHPLNFLFLLFPGSEMPKALGYYIWIHYLLFYIGAYLFLRALRCDRKIAAMMAATLSLSGYLLSVHSLAHLLAASVAVPWFFYFQKKYLAQNNILNLFAASFFLAWPVYAGDPQFSYMLAIISWGFFTWNKKFTAWLKLGALSLMAAAAQLLPTISDIFKSQRISMDSNEMLLFSFHPIRIAEIFYPIFFGNRYGGDEYWGGSYINFNYKHPFIFSLYPGILVLLALFFFPIIVNKWRKRKKYPEILLSISVVAGFLVSFGVFFPLPLYDWLSKVVPLFGFFRYPERFLFWPMFSVWILASLTLQKILRLPQIPWKKSTFALPISFFCLSIFFYLGNIYGWIDLHDSAIKAVKKSAIFMAVFLALLLILSKIRMEKKLVPFLLFAALGTDLWLHQTQLIWDQNKHIADGERYRLVREMKSDLEKRKVEISHGASFRFGSENLNKFFFYTDLMDHTTSTSFAAFENLVPNVPALFGIEDIAGYFSFLPQNRFTFWDGIIRLSPFGGVHDLRFYFDLMGAYYLPERDKDQEIILKKNESAQPYLFIPSQVFYAQDFPSALKKARDMNFRSNRDVIIVDQNQTGMQQQTEERGNFLITKRNGRRIEFSYAPENPASKKYVTLNESFDSNWRAYVNEKKIPVQLANGWSMGIQLKDVKTGEKIEVSFRYENIYITIGAILTGIWLFLFLTTIIIDKKRAA